jgi:hypothetical protein
LEREQGLGRLVQDAEIEGWIRNPFSSQATHASGG